MNFISLINRDSEMCEEIFNIGMFVEKKSVQISPFLSKRFWTSHDVIDKLRLHTVFSEFNSHRVFHISCFVLN